MLPWKLQKRQILTVYQNLLSVYFSLAKFQLVSCNLSLAMIWQMTYTFKLPKLCSATLMHCKYVLLQLTRPAQDLLMSLALNCNSHSTEDVEVISNLIRMRLKTKPLANHYVACIKYVHFQVLNTLFSEAKFWNFIEVNPKFMHILLL